MGESFYSEDEYAYDSDDNAPEFTDFGFGFNNPKFSDRILRLEILPDPHVAKLRKLIGDGELNSGSQSSSGSSCKVTTIHINSLILAAKSPVFLKMFTNGMKESEQKTVTISLHASEEKALLDLIGFLYKSTLPPKTSFDVLNVLKLAERYHVTSCATYCRRLMQEYPMTLELALAYEELPATILAGVSFQTLMRDATHFLSKIERSPCSHEDALRLPLERVENILSSKELAASEDEVFNFALKWVTANYDDLTERSEVFCSRICPLIRFPSMSDAKLEEALHRTELNQVNATKMVAEALLDKSGNLRTPRALSPTQRSGLAHKFFPVKVTVFNSPHGESIAYLAVNKGDIFIHINCGKIYTQLFHVGKECFMLSISCTEPNEPSRSQMTVGLTRIPRGAVKVEYEFGVRSGTTGKYVYKGVQTSVFGGSGLNYFPKYSIPLNSGEYTIDGVFYFRVIVTAAVNLF